MDLTPYQFPDGADVDQERYLEQQVAEATRARRVSTPEQTIERQELRTLIDFLRYQRAYASRPSRMHVVRTRHARR